MASAVMKFICSNRGSFGKDELLFNMFFSDPSELQAVISDEEKFVTYSVEGEVRVVARTDLRLCKCRNCQGCGDLHLCKNYLMSGRCPFDQQRRGCLFSHEMDSPHNLTILRQHNLEDLSRSELSTLLLQCDPSLLPPICFDYNNSTILCKDGDACKRLHVCEKFVKGKLCGCFRNHDFYDAQPRKSLQEKRVPDELVHSLKSVYWNKMALRICDHRSNRGNRTCKGNNMANNNSNSQQLASSAVVTTDHIAVTDGGNVVNGMYWPLTSPNESNVARVKGPKRGQWHGLSKNAQPVRDKGDICMYFIKGYCKLGDCCPKVHEKLPYRWEIKQGDQWLPMGENETIEKDFCNPANVNSSTTPAIHFDAMTCDGKQVRRLSTVSSALEPTFVLTTEWMWYWKDEHGQWNHYASSTTGHKSADVDSTKLEHKFQNNDKDVVEFTAGAQLYTLSFQEMMQTNKHYGTKRPVKRRPQFVSSADVQMKKTRKPPLQTAFNSLPSYWDKTQITDNGYKRVPLHHSSEEYQEIESIFFDTMQGFEFVKVERIQNKTLWEIFQWQKEQMRKSSRKHYVSERKLFHGTNKMHVDAICHNNFDFRICGLHGTAYGKGSYFARDAKQSHNYTGNNEVRFMFMSRVLVGEFTKGCPEYRRPPSKDGGDINFYDSCVDDVRNPSIFVVFERHQIYPEYLLQYKDKNPAATQHSAFVTPTTLKVPSAPQPSKLARANPKPIYQTNIYTPTQVQPLHPTRSTSTLSSSSKTKGEMCVIS